MPPGPTADEAFFLLASLRSDDRARQTLTALGVPLDSVMARIETRLEQARPQAATATAAMSVRPSMRGRLQIFLPDGFLPHDLLVLAEASGDIDEVTLP